MQEVDYRKLVASKLEAKGRTVFQELPMRYDIGSYERGASFGMPNCFLDIVLFDEEKRFHIYELKVIGNNEIWTGKFFGQLLLYNFLFRTEPWNELAGRLVMRAKQRPELVNGEIDAPLEHLASFGAGEVADEDDPNASVSSLNLVVCGGEGFELAAGYNPVIWSFWVEFSELLEQQQTDFNIFHFYCDGEDYRFDAIQKLSVDEPNSLTKNAQEAYRRLELDG